MVAGVRDMAKAADLQAHGVELRMADYDKPETLAAALRGIDRLLLISGNAVGQRTRQHTAVIAAAKAAGVKLIAYTSVLRADTSKLGLAVEHKATEEALAASGVPHVLLRNGWYLGEFRWPGHHCIADRKPADLCGRGPLLGRHACRLRGCSRSRAGNFWRSCRRKPGTGGQQQFLHG